MKQGILAGILALFFLMFSVVGYTLETPEEELPEELLDLKNAAEEPAFSYGTPSWIWPGRSTTTTTRTT